MIDQITEPEASSLSAIVFDVGSAFSDMRLSLSGRDYTTVLSRMYKSQEYNAALLGSIVETPRRASSRVLVVVSSVLHGARLSDALTRLTGKVVPVLCGSLKAHERQRILESSADIAIVTAPMLDAVLAMASLTAAPFTDLHIVGAALSALTLSTTVLRLSHANLASSIYEYHADVPMLRGTHARSLKMYREAHVRVLRASIKKSSWEKYVTVFTESAKRVTVAAGGSPQLVASCTPIIAAKASSEYPDAFGVLDADKVRASAMARLESDLRAVVETFERVEGLGGQKWVVAVTSTPAAKSLDVCVRVQASV